MRTFARDAKKLVHKAEEDSEKRTDCGNLIVASPKHNALLDISVTANAFVKMTDDYATEFQKASKFQFDLIEHVNPSSKTTDKMFAWGIEPHCKTLHDGMKRVFCKLG